MKKTLFLSISILILSPTLVSATSAAYFDMYAPIYFMKSNSTAKIYTKYVLRGFADGYWNISPEIYFAKPTHDEFVSANGTVNVTAVPNLVPRDKNNTEVTFTITAKNGTEGIYEIKTQDECWNYQGLVVDLNESKVNPDILPNLNHDVCAMLTIDPPVIHIVNYTGIISKNSYQIYDSQDIKIPPPLEQVRSGTAPSEITCSYGFLRIYNAHNGSPACVTFEIAKMLAERGWSGGIPMGWPKFLYN